MWIERQFKEIWAAPAQPVRVLIGPRQVGKSAFLEHEATALTRRIVTFDDLATRDLAQRDPRQFLNDLGRSAIIDEAHYVPEIFPELKLIVDELKRQRLRATDSAKADASYWLTGSNRVLLDQSVAETLTGRASYFRFHGLSVAELSASFKDLSFSDIVMRGGWPELYTDRSLSPVAYLNDYISTSLEKDVASIGIQKIAEFIRVLKFVSGRIGCLFDVSEVAKDAGIRSQTVAGWLQYAVRMMLLHRVEVFSTNITTRLIKSPKYFFLDTGLAVRMQGWGQVEPLLVSPGVGHFFENLVLSEIVKCRDCYLPALEIAHWRTKDKEEVDFVLSMNGKHLAIEAKLSAREAATIKMPREIAKIPHLTFATVSFEAPRAERGDNVQRIGLKDLVRGLRSHFS